MRIAHLSDLHFASWDWNISQLFSKRWLGNLNYLFGRRSGFDHTRLNTLPLLLKSLGVECVVITGDLSTTSAPAEFRAAKNFIKQLEDQLGDRGMEVLCIPGNHDHYTQEAYKKRHFYDHFLSRWDMGELKKEGVTTKKLSPHWTLVGLDTALATSWFHSTGFFSPQTEKALDEVLSRHSDEQILLMNHFPFSQHESPRKQLVRGEALQQLLEKHPQVKIYCHGHTHRRCLAPLMASGLPLVLDSGSTSLKKNGGFYLIDLLENAAKVEHYQWNKEWQPSPEGTYELV